MKGALYVTFGIFGNATGLFLFLSPVVTFKRIVKNKSTEQFSGIPYVMTLLNCLLSTWYGMPFVSPNNILVSTINGAGSVIEIIYASVLLLFSAIAIISMVVFPVGTHRKVFCGVMAAVFSIIMYGSPLSVMTMVIKTKSVEYMPFLLSLFAFLCGTSWFIYGLLGKDPFVFISNGVGSALGAVQLILYLIYYDRSGAKNTKTSGSLEMGNGR